MKFLVRRNQTSAILGILVVVVALSGVPSIIRTTLLIILGLLIAGIGFLTHRTLEGFFSSFNNHQDNAMVAVGGLERADEDNSSIAARS